VDVKQRLLIGVDPGKACGFAYLNGEQFTSDDLSLYDACAELERLLKRGQPTVVAVERFTFQASSSKKTRQYDALEFIGVARFLCTKYSVQLLIQGAAEASKVGSPQVLRVFRWWKKGYDHANKAAAQVALALARTHPVEFERMLGPGII
jgi:hypothetical protein